MKRFRIVGFSALALATASYLHTVGRARELSHAEMQSITGGDCFRLKSMQCTGVVGGCAVVDCVYEDHPGETLDGHYCQTATRPIKQPDYDNVAPPGVGEEGRSATKTEHEPETNPLNYYACVKVESCVQGSVCDQTIEMILVQIFFIPPIWVEYPSVRHYCKAAGGQTDGSLQQLRVPDDQSEECETPGPGGS